MASLFIITAFVWFNTDQKNEKKQIFQGNVAILKVKSFSSNDKLSSRINEDVVAPKREIAAAPAEDQRLLTPQGGAASRLHDFIVSEVRDSAWSGRAAGTVDSVLNRIPYLADRGSLLCGATRCELTVAMLPGISEYNAQHVATRLHNLPAEIQSPEVAIEGVFPVKNANGTRRGYMVVYMRQ